MRTKLHSLERCDKGQISLKTSLKLGVNKKNIKDFRERRQKTSWEAVKKIEKD